MMDEKKKKDNIIILNLKNIFIKNIKFKIFAVLAGFLFWLFMSISI